MGRAMEVELGACIDLFLCLDPSPVFQLKVDLYLIGKMGRIKPQTLLQQSKKKKGPTRISVSTIVACNLIIIFLMLSLVAIYRHRAKPTTNGLSSGSNNLEEIENIEGMERTTLLHEARRLPQQAILNTTKGLITMQLYVKSSPSTVTRFIERRTLLFTVCARAGINYHLSASVGSSMFDSLLPVSWRVLVSHRGYFNGLCFHRVIKHFVIQGGDPKFAGTREDWTVGGQLNTQLEFSPKHEAFMLGTSKSEDRGDGFELFITTAPIPDLNDKLTVFGRVIKGEDVVQEIEEVDTDEHFRPKSPIIINDISFKDEL
ncbi:hypothetical protein SUGI_0055540 [Cryptomeria japonica]|nr:hypothetical protein SUGI_0055540 [Cryptomeria japonica]